MGPGRLLQFLQIATTSRYPLGPPLRRLHRSAHGRANHACAGLAAACFAPRGCRRGFTPGFEGRAFHSPAEHPVGRRGIRDLGWSRFDRTGMASLVSVR